MTLTKYQSKEETLESLGYYWRDSANKLQWPSPFVWPPWLQAWWETYGGEGDLFLRSFWDGDEILGIAPLMLQGDRAVLLGSEDVCDYQDLVISRGREKDFFSALVQELKEREIHQVELPSLRADALTFQFMWNQEEAGELGGVVAAEEVVLERELGSSWEEYLGALKKKQRHEVRRKLRRLQEAGEVEYLWLSNYEEIEEYFELFLRLFRESKHAKEEFLTPQRKKFFRQLLIRLGEGNHWKMGVLFLSGDIVSIVWCLDDGECIYLYNSGFHREYSHLSVGLMGKVLAIRESIERGKACFNFLKGGEIYKYRLGGKEVPVYRFKLKLPGKGGVFI